jgi:hypothetical protein
MPQVVHGSLGEVMKGQHVCTVPIPRLERRRNSRAVLCLFSGTAAPASGFNGLALLGRGK